MECAGSIAKWDYIADTAAIAELYGVDVRTINYHIKKILEDHELDENAVIRNIG